MQMLRFRMLRLEKGKRRSSDWAAAARRLPLPVRAAQQDKAAQGWHLQWCSCGKRVGTKNKSIRKKLSFHPHSCQCWICLASTPVQCLWHVPEAASWESSNETQRFFTDVAFTLCQLESVARLLLFYVAERWKRTSRLLHLWSNRQIREQRCSG